LGAFVTVEEHGAPSSKELGGTTSRATPDQEADQDSLKGRWLRFRSDRRDGLNEEQREIERLESLGDLTGSGLGAELAGVVTFDQSLASPGYNFYVSGHGTEAILMDMNGQVLHTWSHDFDKIWPGAGIEEGEGRYYWRRAFLYENGDILAIHEYIGLIKLDKHSNLLWKYKGNVHHDLDVMEDGTIFVLTREAKMIPRINAVEPVLDDFIVQLDADGRELSKISILECLERFEGKNRLDKMFKKGHILHTNTIEILDGRLAGKLPEFRAGNALISIGNMDAIAVVDLENEKIVWGISGNWHRQHHPTLLPNGKILLFDNQGHKGKSKVIEFDPVTERGTWKYAWAGFNPFFSKRYGSCQRLNNGNTLITESDNGRAFEVTSKHMIVWEFITPHHAPDNDEYFATLFELIRLDPDFPIEWIP
jgi:hypothetical protein